MNMSCSSRPEWEKVNFLCAFKDIWMSNYLNCHWKREIASTKWLLLGERRILSILKNFKLMKFMFFSTTKSDCIKAKSLFTVSSNNERGTQNSFRTHKSCFFLENNSEFFWFRMTEQNMLNFGRFLYNKFIDALVLSWF